MRIPALGALCSGFTFGILCLFVIKAIHRVGYTCHPE